LATLSSPGSNNNAPKISENNSSSALISYANAAWVSTNGANTVIQAASGSKSTVAPPSNLAVSQNVNQFGVFNDYYNTLSWTASTEPAVAGYAIFRNGLMIAQVTSSELKYIDNNAIQNGSVTYGVATIDAQAILSVIQYVTFP
jgi:hypothetical protein